MTTEQISSPPRIVVLDGATLNPGDLTWDGLAALGNLEVHARTATDERLARSNEAEVLLTNKVMLDAELLAKLPTLKLVAVTATGTNVVDHAAARAAGIVVCNVPAYSSESVAQRVFAFILDFTQRVAVHDESVQAGDWNRCPDFCYSLTPLIELNGQTLGLVGFGGIGSRVAELGKAFGMRVLVNRKHPVPLSDGMEACDLESLFRKSDFISLHCPLTAETERLINAESLKKMKPGACLINTGRGPLVDEAALARALTSGQIAGAGLDVLCEEPPGDSPLIGAPNCRITPHNAWATRAARARCLEVSEENVRAFLSGSPINVVN